MAERDDLDDLLGGLDRPVAPRAAFAEELRARLLAELARPASIGEEPFMQTSPLPNGTRPRSLDRPRRPHWLTTAFEIAAALVLLVGFWQVADRFFGSPDVGPNGGNHASQAASTLPAPTMQPAIAAPSPIATATASVPSAMAGGDPGRTGQQPGPAPSGALAAPVVIDNAGSYNRGGTAPVALDGVLYRVASIKTGAEVNGGVPTELHLEARDIATSAVKWSVALDAAVTGSPAVADGRVFIFMRPSSAPGATVVNAYSATDGNLLWSTPAASPNGWRDWSFVSPIVADGVVYAAGIDGTAYAIDAADGTEVWTSMAAQVDATISEDMQPGVTMYGSGQTAVGNGHLYLVNANADLVALNLRDGSLAWSINVSKAYGIATRQMQPFVSGDAVLLLINATTTENQQSAATNRLIAVKANDGGSLWETTLPEGEGPRGLAIAGGIAMVAYNEDVGANDLEGYRLTDGGLAWHVASAGFKAAVMGATAVGTDAYLVNSIGQLVRVASETGDVTILDATASTPTDPVYAPVISDGVIVLDHGIGSGQIVILSSGGAGTPVATP